LKEGRFWFGHLKSILICLFWWWPYLDIDCYLEAMEIGAADYLERCAAPRDFMRSVDSHLLVQAAA